MKRKREIHARAILKCKDRLNVHGGQQNVCSSGIVVLSTTSIILEKITAPSTNILQRISGGDPFDASRPTSVCHKFNVKVLRITQVH